MTIRPEPLRPEALAQRLADWLLTTPAQVSAPALRVAIDGPVQDETAELADAVAARLQSAGRPAVRVSAWQFLRPASLRLEYGRDDADAYYDIWFDLPGLDREVLGPLGPGGAGRYLPSLWDARSDRATRASRIDAPPGAVLVLDGCFLLRPELEGHLDAAVHVRLSEAARRRRIPDADHARALPALARYELERAPAERADVLVVDEDPRRPALLPGAGRRHGGAA